MVSTDIKSQEMSGILVLARKSQEKVLKYAESQEKTGEKVNWSGKRINKYISVIDRSPLKYKVARGLTALVPNLIVDYPNIALNRMKLLLEEFFNANRITDAVAENAKGQFAVLVLEAKGKFREHSALFETRKKKLIL